MTTSLQMAYTPEDSTGVAEQLAPTLDTTERLLFNHLSFSRPIETFLKEKKKIMILDNEQITDQINKYLSPIENCEVMHVQQVDRAFHMIAAFKPDLIIMNMNSDMATDADLIEEMRQKTYTYYIPVIVFTQLKPSPNQEEFIISIGAIDCLNSLIDPTEIRFRIQAAFALSSVLNDFIVREAKMMEETERMKINYEQIKDELINKEREAHSNLELLTYSRQLNQSMILKVKELKPYLNPEGKSRLGMAVKQMNWEIQDENQLNLEKQMDQSNYSFYQLLEEKSPDLTKYEKRLCSYFQTNHSSADTARIMRRTSNCMNVAFLRIRSKLGVKNNHELQTFLADLHTSAQVSRSLA